MDIHASDKEQVDAIKKWVKENGASVITGVLLVLAIVFGGRSWLAYQQGQAEQAGALYMQQINALNAGDTAAALQRGERLVSERGDSAYGTLGALAMARAELDRSTPEAAVSQLRWAVEHGEPAYLRELARLRLARLHIARGETDAAEPLLRAARAGAMAPLADELEGDLQAARGDTEAAGAAYERALAALPPEAGQLRALIQLKRNDLGIADAGGAS